MSVSIRQLYAASQVMAVADVHAELVVDMMRSVREVDDPVGMLQHAVGVLLGTIVTSVSSFELIRENNPSQAVGYIVDKLVDRGMDWDLAMEILDRIIESEHELRRLEDEV